MKKLSLYIFLVLMVCNVGFADKYILTCTNNDNFLKVYSVDENKKKIVHLSSKDLNNGMEYNNLNQIKKIISWKNKIVNVYSNYGTPTYITFNLNKRTFLSSGHYIESMEIYNQKYKCIIGG